MKLRTLNKRSKLVKKDSIGKKYNHFLQLLKELNKRQLRLEILAAINGEIDKINAVSTSEKEFEKQLATSQHFILKLIEKELQLVAKNHYRNTWLAIGMAAFGIPLGVAFGSSLGNIAYIGIGLLFGFVIGIAVGSSKDQNAAKEGRQLNWEAN